MLNRGYQVGTDYLIARIGLVVKVYQLENSVELEGKGFHMELESFNTLMDLMDKWFQLTY